MSDTYYFNRISSHSYQEQEQSIFNVFGQPSSCSHRCQEVPTEQTKVCRIKRKTIVHPQLKKVLKKNGNMPKFIIGNFYRYLEEYNNWYINQEDYVSVRDEVGKWLERRIDLNLTHLKLLLGGDSKRNYENCRVLNHMIAQYGLEMTTNSSKVSQSLSYLVCLEKYTSRLGNQKLIERVQSR